MSPELFILALDGWSGFNHITELLETTVFGDEGKMLKKDREECWEAWHEAKDNLSNGYNSLSESNYYHYKDLASKAYNDAGYDNPHEVLKDIKQVQSEMKGVFLTKEHRSEIRELLNSAFESAISKLEENKRERQRKQEEWEEKMNSNIERWESAIEKQESFISRMEEQIDDLEDKISEARTSEYEDRLRGWIEEKYDKIRDAQATIESLNEKIRSVKDRLYH